MNNDLSVVSNVSKECAVFVSEHEHELNRLVDLAQATANNMYETAIIVSNLSDGANAREFQEWLESSGLLKFYSSSAISKMKKVGASIKIALGVGYDIERLPKSVENNYILHQIKGVSLSDFLVEMDSAEVDLSKLSQSQIKQKVREYKESERQRLIKSRIDGMQADIASYFKLFNDKIKQIPNYEPSTDIYSVMKMKSMCDNAMDRLVEMCGVDEFGVRTDEYEFHPIEIHVLNPTKFDTTVSKDDIKLFKYQISSWFEFKPDDTDSEDTDSRDTDSENTDSQDAYSENTDSENTDSQDTDSENTDSQDTDVYVSIRVHRDGYIQLLEQLKSIKPSKSGYTSAVKELALAVLPDILID